MLNFILRRNGENDILFFSGKMDIQMTQKSKDLCNYLGEKLAAVQKLTSAASSDEVQLVRLFYDQSRD